MGSLLERIDAPDKLRGLSPEELGALAEELRALIVRTVSATGGHLAPSLGAVELTLALYSVFCPPADQIVWDVGHQAYAHKILTGRRERFAGLRQRRGITGFPSRAESPYDAFGVGHASTSVSAALGMALARDAAGRDEHVVAVIGDGAMTGGMAFEALNHAGDLRTRLIVVLNDNGMSIDSNVGAMSEYLARIRIAPQYNRAKEDIKEFLRGIPRIGDTVFRTASCIKDSVRNALMPGAFFEELGFTYVGPIDGHNIRLMREVFAEARLLDGPVLVHVRTTKGRGYAPAEKDPETFHGVGRFDAATGEVKKDASAPPSYTSVFGGTLVELAEAMPGVAAITAAMPGGTGLKPFAARFPRRFFDVGIAEEHAVTLAAGMAARGMHPVVAVYSTFAQRAYDQILHDVCLQSLPVTLALDRGGLVGEDGPTHHGVFDLSYLGMMPGMTVFVPKDENELRHMLFTALHMAAPAAIRYPRGAGLGVPLDAALHEIEIGSSELLADHGGAVALLALGTMADAAVRAAALLKARGIAACVVNMRFAKPVDTARIDALARTARLFVTLEENVLAGGFGASVASYMADAGLVLPLLRIGVPDRFIPQGARALLLEECGLTPERIAARVAEKWAEME